jgi:hypothetical protein
VKEEESEERLQCLQWRHLHAMASAAPSTVRRVTSRGAAYARWGYLAAACVHCTACAGAIFGWPSIAFILQREGAFASACAGGTGAPCAAQGAALGSLYSAASLFAFCVPAVSGLFQARYGPRTTVRLLSSLFAVGCALLLAWAASPTSRSDALLWPAFILLGTAASSNLLPLYSVATLFPSNVSLVLSVLNGSFDAGTVTFFVMASLYDPLGWPFSRILTAYLAGPVVVMLTLAAFVWPAHPFDTKPTGEEAEKTALPADSPAPLTLRHAPSVVDTLAEAVTAASSPKFGARYDRLHARNGEEEEEVGGARAVDAGTVAPPPSPAAAAHNPFFPGMDLDRLHALPLAKQLTTVEYGAFLAFFCVCLVRFNCYISTVSSQMDVLGQGPDAAYAKIFGFLLPCGFFFDIAIGGLLDRYGPVVGCACVWGTGTLVSVLALVPSLPLQQLTFVVFALFRGWIFCTMAVLLSSLYGFATLPPLIGVLTCVGGLVGLTSNAFNVWATTGVGATAERGNYGPPNAALLALMLAAGAFPLWLARRARG